MKMNKKGFTIVELVIVIVVIAILAAVLIPTFVSLTRKANIANDTAVAKNLNTAAISAQADTFDEAIEAAKEAGYLIANLNAKASDCYFVWEDDTNQFLLYDLKESKVIYSNTDDYGEIDASWCFAISDPESANEVIAKLPSVTIKQTIANAENLLAWLEKGEKQTIYIDSSLALTNEQRLDITKGEITVHLGASSLTSSEEIDGTPVSVKDNSTLNIIGGVIAASGTDFSEATKRNYSQAVDVSDGATLNVDGTKFEGKYDNVMISQSSTINVKNASFLINRDDDNGFVLEALFGTTATFENVDSKVTSYGCGMLFVSDLYNTEDGELISGHDNYEHYGPTKVTLKDVDHEGYWLATVHRGEVVIESGNYVCTDFTNGGIRAGIELGGSSHVIFFDLYTTDAKVVIKGGTFQGVDFANITAEQWEGMTKCRLDGYKANAVKDQTTGEVTITLVENN